MLSRSLQGLYNGPDFRKGSPFACISTFRACCLENSQKQMTRAALVLLRLWGASSISQKVDPHTGDQEKTLNPRGVTAATWQPTRQLRSKE